MVKTLEAGHRSQVLVAVAATTLTVKAVFASILASWLSTNSSWTILKSLYPQNHKHFTRIRIVKAASSKVAEAGYSSELVAVAATTSTVKAVSASWLPSSAELRWRLQEHVPF